MPTATDLWVRIFGEVDLSNRDDLQPALSVIDDRVANSMRVHLRHLTFCDSAAFLVILEFGRKVRLFGHQTHISISNPTMKKLIGFLMREYWLAESEPI